MADLEGALKNSFEKGAGKRKKSRISKSQLGESWGVFDSDDGPSGPAVDSTDDERDIYKEQVSSVEGTEQYDTPKIRRSVAYPNTSPRRSSRPDRKSSEPAIQSPRTVGPTRRRSSRISPQTNSVEPEFIMPSMHQSMEGSFARPSPPPTPPLSSLRSRQSRGSPVIQNSPLRATQTIRRPTKWISSPESEESSSHSGFLWDNIIAPILSYFIGILKSTMGHLRPIFGAVLALWVAISLLGSAFQSTIASGPVGTVLAVLKYVPGPCSLPGASAILPFCSSNVPHATGPVEFEQLITVQSQFEDVLESAAQGCILPLEMKRSEASIRDLRHVVEYSHLPSKNELVFEFTSFIDLARQASSDLTKFNSRIGRAVDHIISTNKHTLKVIDGFVEADKSRGSISRFLFRSNALTEDHLLQQYLKHAGNIEEQIQRLILEAQTLLTVLEHLDGRLDVIHGIVVRDEFHVKGDRDELFAQLWVKLGGNRNSVHKVNEQLRLLNSVNVYRKTAWAHVTGTILKLEAIAAGLEDLRERVALPEVVGVLDVSLQQHIETIQMGVERLETMRESTRALEAQNYRRVLDDGGVAERGRMLEGKPAAKVNLG